MSKERRSGHPLPEYHDEAASEEFWQVMRPRREPLRWRPFLPVVLLLLVFNVPWWLPDRLGSSIVVGLPLFVWSALATSLALAIVTAWAALRHWDDDEPGDGAGDSAERGKG